MLKIATKMLLVFPDERIARKEIKIFHKFALQNFKHLILTFPLVFQIKRSCDIVG